MFLNLTFIYKWEKGTTGTLLKKWPFAMSPLDTYENGPQNVTNGHLCQGVGEESDKMTIKYSYTKPGWENGWK